MAQLPIDQWHGVSGQSLDRVQQSNRCHIQCGRSQSRSTDANANIDEHACANPNADAYRYSHTDYYTNAYGYSHANGNANPHQHADAHSHAFAHSYADIDAHANIYPHAHEYAYSRHRIERRARRRAAGCELGNRGDSQVQVHVDSVARTFDG